MELPSSSGDCQEKYQQPKASTCSVGDPVCSLGQKDPLEKEMATHTSTLAWKIPWMEDPGGLQSMEWQSRA